jgi:hypothetical protein
VQQRGGWDQCSSRSLALRQDRAVVASAVYVVQKNKIITQF